MVGTSTTSEAETETNQVDLGFLLAKVETHDRKSFELLYDQTCRRMYSLALRITGSHELTEEVVSDLEPAPGEYLIRKTRMSAFMQTELDLMLRTLSVDTVIVVGIQTPNCIRTTVFDAFALNYRTFLVEDAVAAQNDEIHRSNCRDMAAIGVGMVKTAEVESLIRSS